MKKFTRDRVVPTISASVVCEIGGTARTGFVVLAVPRQQQERPGQPFLAGVEQLVDQVLLDPDVSCQQVGNEPIGHGVLRVEQRHHLFLVHKEDAAVGGGVGRTHTHRLSCQAAFAEELADVEHRHDRFPARLGEHRELHGAFLDIQHMIAWIALGEDDLSPQVFHDPLGDSR
jgi:hypothetical protein